MLRKTSDILYINVGHKSGVSNPNCSEGQIRIYKVTRGPHQDADVTMAVPNLTRNNNTQTRNVFGLQIWILTWVIHVI